MVELQSPKKQIALTDVGCEFTNINILLVESYGHCFASNQHGEIDLIVALSAEFFCDIDECRLSFWVLDWTFSITMIYFKLNIPVLHNLRNAIGFRKSFIELFTI